MCSNGASRGSCPSLHEPLGLTLRIWFRSGDEDAHRSRLGEACQKLWPRTRNEVTTGLGADLAASFAVPVISTACHSVPSGLG